MATSNYQKPLKVKKLSYKIVIKLKCKRYRKHCQDYYITSIEKTIKKKIRLSQSTLNNIKNLITSEKS